MEIYFQQNNRKDINYCKDNKIQKLSECKEIIKAAKKLIKSNIKTVEFESNYYPLKLNIKNYDDSLPPNLRSFKEAPVSNEVK